MKLSEQSLLELRCRLEKYITEREGMIAENKMRESLGRGLAYIEDSFEKVQAKIEELENHVITIGEI